jgi:hypothetical protein
MSIIFILTSSPIIGVASFRLPSVFSSVMAQGPEGSLYVSDDSKGTIYKMTYKK